jgi:translation initiation factor IF-1
MAGEDVFKVEGIIVEARPNRTFQVELPNGHRVLAYVTGKARSSFGAVMGQKVTLQLSPYDLSQGRILAGAEKI